MNDTDLLHMAALEARLTEAEHLLRLAQDALRQARFPSLIYVKAVEEYKQKVKIFLGEE